MKYKLVLENGLEFIGTNFGCNEETIGEIFFHTSMVGYQDILSDPSYYGKIACMTYPLIGNYGLTDEDYDFKNIHIKGYVVKENNDYPSNFRETRTLSDAMEENKVTGIEDIDTREITKIIRDNGTMKAMICEESKPLEECLKQLKDYQEEDNIVAKVSCKKIWYSRTANPTHTIVILDLGVKTTLVKRLNEYGFNVIVVPYNTTLEQIKKLKPNGIIISNGPGNPNKLTEVIELINSLKSKYSVLGLGLGASLLALTYNGKVNKMKHGHQGANIPVKNLLTNKIEITSQNHFFEISELNDEVKVVEVSVVGNDIEMFVSSNHKVIGVQYNMTSQVIEQFVKTMKR